MRMISAYETLWDDVTKHFLTHRSSNVVRRAVATIKHMLSTASLANTNTKKILELEEELSVALRESVSAMTDLETSALDDEELQTLDGTIYRISSLISIRDMVSWLEDDDSGQQRRPLDIVISLVERSRLGNKAENSVSTGFTFQYSRSNRGFTDERKPYFYLMLLYFMEISCDLCGCGW